MAGNIMGQVLALPASLLKPVEKLLLVTIANYANRNGDGAYPAVQTLANAAGLKVRQTQYLLRRLEARGLIVQSAPPGRYRGRTYRIAAESWVQSSAPMEPAMGAVASAPHGCSFDPIMGAVATAPDPGIDPVREPKNSVDVRDGLILGGSGSATPPPKPQTGTKKVRLVRGEPVVSAVVLLALAMDVVEANPTDGYVDLVEALKCRCAQLHVVYDSDGTHGAIERALARRDRRDTLAKVTA